MSFVLKVDLTSLREMEHNVIYCRGSGNIKTELIELYVNSGVDHLSARL